MMGRSVRWKARYTVISVLFVTWVVSYLDRMVMSVAMPYISTDYHLSPAQSGILLSAFFAGYSITHIPGGVLADIFGGRRVATLAMLWWSALTAVTGATGSFAQMLVARFSFGLGEGIFPACAFKSIATWFPKRERATANAVMMASNTLGAGISPIVVVAIMSVWGWRAVFFCLCVPGLIVALLYWLFISDDPARSRRVSPAEVAEIQADDAEEDQVPVTRGELVGIVLEASVVRYFLILFSFDVAYWGFSTWLPTYLVKARGLSMMQMGIVASLPFFAGTIGRIFGGWLSDTYFATRRRLPIVIAQLASALFLYLTLTAVSMTALIVFQTLTGLFLALFFSFFWAMPMTTVPKRLMGVASGFINMGGQIAAFISPMVIGFLVQSAKGGFGPTFLFLIAALLVSAAIVALPSRGPKPHPRPMTVG